MILPVQYSQLQWREKRMVREEYTRLQDGKCFYCQSPLDGAPANRDKAINLNLFPPNFMKYPVHLQHDHGTDMTEGAVHAYCNAVMWQYEGR